MNLNLSFSGQDESRLQKQATAAGQDAEAFVRQVIEKKLAGRAPGSLRRGIIGALVGSACGFGVMVGLSLVNDFFVPNWLSLNHFLSNVVLASLAGAIFLVGFIGGGAKVGASLAYRSWKRLRLLLGFFVGLLAGPALGVALALVFHALLGGPPLHSLGVVPLFGLIGWVIGPVIGIWVANRLSRR